MKTTFAFSSAREIYPASYTFLPPSSTNPASIPLICFSRVQSIAGFCGTKNGFGSSYMPCETWGFYRKSVKLIAVSYTHLRAHETRHDLVCRLLLEKKKK